MSALTKALERIRNWLQINYPSAAGFPNPGLTLAQIKEITKNLPFKLSKEVYELYQWRNGTPLSHIFSLFVVFYPLEQSLEMYRVTLNNQVDRESLSPNGLIIFSADDHFYYINSGEKEEESSKIRCWTGGWEEDEICYISLTNLMMMIAECYETNAYYIERYLDRKYLQEDKIKSELIFHKYNPGLKFHSPA